MGHPLGNNHLTDNQKLVPLRFLAGQLELALPVTAAATRPTFRRLRRYDWPMKITPVPRPNRKIY
jgi:hypothetical protein